MRHVVAAVRARDRLRMPLSGCVDVFRPAMLELVLRTESLPAIALRADAEPFAAAAAVAKPADGTFDSSMAAKGLGDRRARADSYRASSTVRSSKAPGVAAPGVPLGATSER
jgi:hypothetical protein